MNRKSNVTVTKVAQAACDMYFIGVAIVELSFGTLICDQSYTDGTQGFEVIPKGKITQMVGSLLCKAHHQWKDDQTELLSALSKAIQLNDATKFDKHAKAAGEVTPCPGCCLKIMKNIKCN
jgi:hypothetical protein